MHRRHMPCCYGDRNIGLPFSLAACGGSRRNKARGERFWVTHTHTGNHGQFWTSVDLVLSHCHHHHRCCCPSSVCQSLAKMAALGCHAGQPSGGPHSMGYMHIVPHVCVYVHTTLIHDGPCTEATVRREEVSWGTTCGSSFSLWV